ncbi:hypothetical protein Halru_1936 [Halovivax ruber XH-70]|uniref:Uncharacterized protein n=2 Tax=Halovivax ruber TaxID=387341 RepID=L0ICP5_HALRX|nr:hypothetical protein Halru_1936 [Halovivax ruber XH-70]
MAQNPQTGATGDDTHEEAISDAHTEYVVMSSIRTYTIIYILLLALATAKVGFEMLPLGTGMFVGVIVVLASIKIVLIAGWFQHLVEEPRSITYMMLTSLFMVLLLVAAAGYSIQGA